MSNQSLEKNILTMNLAKQFLLVKLYSELESLAKKIEKKMLGHVLTKV